MLRHGVFILAVLSACAAAHADGAAPPAWAGVRLALSRVASDGGVTQGSAVVEPGVLGHAWGCEVAAGPELFDVYSDDGVVLTVQGVADAVIYASGVWSGRGVFAAWSSSDAVYRLGEVGSRLPGEPSPDGGEYGPYWQFGIGLFLWRLFISGYRRRSLDL